MSVADVYLILFVIAGIALALVAYDLFIRSGSGFLSISEIAEDQLWAIEGSIEGLRRVVVVAHIVERPNQNLLEAVEKNFNRGVQYLFLVSASNRPDSINEYGAYFEAAAQITIKQQGLDMKGHQLVRIHNLAYEWLDVPYIFYEYSSASDDRAKYLVLRGNKAKEGLAPSYSVVDSRDAHTIARAALSGDADVYFDSATSVDQFSKDAPISNVVSFRKAGLSH